MPLKKLIIIACLALGFLPTKAQNKNTVSATTGLAGRWRGIFKLPDNTDVPFNFEIGLKNGNLNLVFLNATERFDGGTVTQTADSVFVRLNQFDNEFAFKLKGDSLIGVLRKQDQSATLFNLKAKKGELYRFKPTAKSPAADFSGTYQVFFKTDNIENEKAIGVFKQNGKKLSGTFLRVTGDTRYLEGIIDGNDFYLSSFIGSNPSYFTGSFAINGAIKGEQISAKGKVPFTGNKNKNAVLPDAYQLTSLKDSVKTLDFSLPDINGNKISLKDKKYEGKVVILTIAGTWCPNCVDEASFLAPWYKANKKRGVEIIGIHFERNLDPEYLKKVIGRFRDKFDIQYDQVVAGKPDPKAVAEALPALKNFVSFPTTIFINKKGEVAEIHTGYSGPATGKYYTDFVKKFNAEIDRLVKE